MIQSATHTHRRPETFNACFSSLYRVLQSADREPSVAAGNAFMEVVNGFRQWDSWRLLWMRVINEDESLEPMEQRIDELLDYAHDVGVRRVVEDCLRARIPLPSPQAVYGWSAMLHVLLNRSQLIRVSRPVEHCNWPVECFEQFLNHCQNVLDGLRTSGREEAILQLNSFRVPPINGFYDYADTGGLPRSPVWHESLEYSWSLVRRMGLERRSSYPVQPTSIRSIGEIRNALDTLLNWCADQPEIQHDETWATIDLPTTPSQTKSERWPTEPPPDGSRFAVGPLRGKLKALARWMHKTTTHLRQRNEQLFFYIQNEGSEFACWFQTQEQFAAANRKRLEEQNGTERNGTQ